MNPLLSAISRHFHRPNLHRGHFRTDHRKPRRTRPCLEVLEERTLLTAVAAPSGIVSWWTANNTAADAMGLNNATLTGVHYATGEVGQAFSFDGQDDWAALGNPSSLAFTNSFTIEGWIKVNGLPPTTIPAPSCSAGTIAVAWTRTSSLFCRTAICNSESIIRATKGPA